MRKNGAEYKYESQSSVSPLVIFCLLAAKPRMRGSIDVYKTAFFAPQKFTFGAIMILYFRNLFLLDIRYVVKAHVIVKKFMPKLLIFVKNLMF